MILCVDLTFLPVILFESDFLFADNLFVTINFIKKQIKLFVCKKVLNLQRNQ